MGGALSWTAPAFLARTFAEFEVHAANDTQVATGQDSPILVILQMAGGNDGLNTVVPYGNDHYRRARARIGLRPDAVLKLNDEWGLHAAVLEEWLKTSSGPILGRKFEPLQIV